eukprot:CAMPEP_0194190586 /NCGR_PEP_ID=MMETSP0154-20130528/63493_1 /TAXON_ID=1049557 /ORGANISM="Thalassiothrix antarctica, Strain L6-D1" /LENGTH=225 /DNA_ID=CAMNT_0038912621 /DNA_START=127 /DNA_END=804 /DNA_ORIENTATION=-
MTFSERLRDTAGEQWNRVIKHRFTSELADGTISKEVLARYLVQDHRFLDAFVVLLSSMIAVAHCLEDRIEGCQFLALITGKENTYFERSFTELGIDKQQRVEIPNAPVTDGFLKLMNSAAKDGSLGEKLAVLVVCEWSYLSWGQLVLEKTNRDCSFVTHEWVDLHSGSYFESVISYLRRLLDEEGDRLDEKEQRKCEQKFLETVQFEEDFFDFAYSKVENFEYLK